MNKKQLIIAVISLCLMSFAQGFNAEGIPPYETKEDILEAYGEPFYKDKYERTEVWYYPRPFQMSVFFDDKGKVVRIDFSTNKHP